MRPVILSIVENRNFILGSFDIPNLQIWWKSLPFAGGVEKIEDITHVYGQYHVCIVKMLDGTYSIYRTHDSGKTWVQVYNTPDTIYSITKIDYGWVIASTSTGWLESVLDSGLTWEKISSFAPGCKTVINVSDNVLFAHDCNYIWRSYDQAKSWSKVLDVHDFDAAMGGQYNWSRKWTGYCPPALDGFDGRIVIGCGPYLLYSDMPISSDMTPGDWYIASSSWCLGELPFISKLSDTKILQVAITDIRSRNPEDATLMIRLHDIKNNKVLYITSTNNGTSSFNLQFELPYKGDNTGTILSYQVNKIGTAQKDSFAAVNFFDSENNSILKYSTNGGTVWNSIVTKDVIVYEGNPEQEIPSEIGQYVFEENYLGPKAWVTPICQNEGHWVSKYNRIVQGVSWDIDFITKYTALKDYSSLCGIVNILNNNYDFDMINKKPTNKEYTMYMLKNSTNNKNLIVSGYIKTTFEKLLNNIDVINAAKINKSIDFNILSLKRIDSVFNMRMNQKDAVEKSCGFVIKLVDDHVDEIMTSINRYTLQAPDIRYPSIPYVPFDSRDQEVT
ncbi:MAG: hypothetical protein WC319_14915 [Candidatus Paceibacterota bacterium]|jgi:hypothetical protein